jgi:hypothetical protein
LVKANAPDGNGFCAGSKLSIADVALMDLADLYLRIFDAEMRATVRSFAKLRRSMAARLSPHFHAECNGACGRTYC